MPRADADALLLTVDRFVAAGATDVTPIEREELLARFGLYGVRTSVRLIRLGGAGSATELAAELRAVSGIEDLRRLLTTLFTERRDVLKARAALAALETVAARPRRPRRQCCAEHERVVASAHELTELQIIAAMRSGRVPFAGRRGRGGRAAARSARGQRRRTSRHRRPATSGPPCWPPSTDGDGGPSTRCRRGPWSRRRRRWCAPWRVCSSSSAPARTVWPMPQ